MGASAAAAIIIRRERELVEHFRSHAALSAAAAKTPTELAVEQRMAWVILLNRGIIRDAGGGRFYLDEAAWEANRAMKRKMAAVMLVVFICAAAAAAFATSNAARR
jgi:hypothetical protein